MRPTQYLLNSAKKQSAFQSFVKSVPAEAYPLFAVMGFVCVIAVVNLGSKFYKDEKNLRVYRAGKVHLNKPLEESDNHH